MDGELRALLRVPVSSTRDGERTELAVWVDTAFNGGLAIPRPQITELGLAKGFSAEAILANGATVELETYACFLDWFGDSYETDYCERRKVPTLGYNAARSPLLED